MPSEHWLDLSIVSYYWHLLALLQWLTVLAQRSAVVAVCFVLLLLTPESY